MRAYSDPAKSEMETLMKNCGVKTEDVPPKLVINKLDGKEMSEETRDYSSLFNRDLNEPDSKRRRSQQRKILLKGPLGSGKSRLARKIQSDWAKRISTTFSVVFFILVKLVNPEEAIENVIVDQYCLPEINKDKIRKLLQNSDRKCCIILDGTERNQFARNILEDKRLSCCDLVYVSDLVSADVNHNHFDTICNVECFQRSELKNLIGSIVKDGNFVQVLDCEIIIPSVLSSVSLETPMVIMLLSILVERLELNLKSKRVTLAEIYNKFVEYLCRGCTKSVPDIIMQMGKLAWEVLTSGRVLRKSDGGVQSIDKAMLDKGLLVSYGNGLMTFAHKSLELFLAAFYCVSVLNGDHVLEPLFTEVCSNSLMTDSLFLYFCLSLTSSERGKAHESLIDIVVAKLDFKQFDFRDVGASYPFLDYSLEYNIKDRLFLDFLDQVLSRCKETKVLLLHPNFPIKQLLSNKTIDSFLNSVSTWILTDGENSINREILRQALSDDLSIVIHDQKQNCVQELITYVGSPGRPYSLYMLQGYESKKFIDISTLGNENVCKISIVREQENCKLKATKYIEYPNLTHFLTSGFKLDKQFLMKLSKSVTEGKLPRIQHLTISGIYEYLGESLSPLFNCQWPTLTHLDLSNTGLKTEDIRRICGVTNSQQMNVFPNLEVLKISDSIPNECFLKQHLKNISSLTYRYTQSCTVAKGYFKTLREWGLSFPSVRLTDDFMMIFREADFEQLDTLVYFGRKSTPGSNIDVEAFCQSGIIAKLQCLNFTGCNLREKLTSLFSEPFSKLENLVLKSCGLSSEDLKTLNEANDNAIFPQLKHLDISENQNMGSVQNLFDLRESHWNSLKSLNIQRLHFQNDFKSLSDMTREGRLNSIESLNVSITKDEFIDNFACWEKLRNIELELRNVPCEQVLGAIADGVERKDCNLFPSLETVYIVSWLASCSADVKLRIRRCGICVHFVLRNW